MESKEVRINTINESHFLRFFGKLDPASKIAAVDFKMVPGQGPFAYFTHINNSMSIVSCFVFVFYVLVTDSKVDEIHFREKS